MERLTRFSLSRPKTTLLLLAAITLVLGFQAPNSKPEFGYRVLVGDDHPAIVALDGLIERFGGGLPIRIAWECGPDRACADVFDPASLSMAHEVSQALAQEIGVLNVIGPSNAPLMIPDEAGFAIRRFVEQGEISPDAERLRERAIRDEQWVGRFIDDVASVGVIVVQRADTTSELELRMVDAIGAVLSPFEASGFEFYVVGEAVGSVTSGRALAESTGRLIPFTVLVIVLVVLVATRSFWQTVACVATMGVALLWTLGILGGLGWPQDGIHEVLAPLILVVGVCDAVHLLSRYAPAVALLGPSVSITERQRLLIEASRDVGPACLVTTLTTAVAFASFAISPLDTFIRFGTIASIGVLICLLLTFTLLPLAIQRLPVGTKAEQASTFWKSLLERLVLTSVRRSTEVIAAFVAMVLFCGIGWGLYLRVATDWKESFGEDSPSMRGMAFLETHLGTANTLEIEIAVPSANELIQPDALAAVAQASAELLRIDDITAVRSVLDLIRTMNRLIHDDDVAFESLGESAQSNAELLELIGLDDPAILNTWMTLGRTRLRLSAEMAAMSSERAASVIERVETSLRRTLPSTWTVVITGEVGVNDAWVRDIQGTQARSLPTALLLVFGVVAAYLRSLKLALAAMLPTLFSVVLTLGAMAWLGLSLDVGRAMIAVVLIGIAVDNSIHLLVQYQRLRDLAAPLDAMQGAVLHCGTAIVTSSLALSLGFLTLTGSAWQSISSFGLFIALGILGAVVGSLLVLPAGIVEIEMRRSWRRSNHARLASSPASL